MLLLLHLLLLQEARIQAHSARELVECGPRQRTRQGHPGAAAAAAGAGGCRSTCTAAQPAHGPEPCCTAVAAEGAALQQGAATSHWGCPAVGPGPAAASTAGVAARVAVRPLFQDGAAGRVLACRRSVVAQPCRSSRADLCHVLAGADTGGPAGGRMLPRGHRVLRLVQWCQAAGSSRRAAGRCMLGVERHVAAWSARHVRLLGQRRVRWRQCSACASFVQP